MKKQFLMFTAAAMLTVALAGCSQPTHKSSAQMGYIGEDAAKTMAVTAAQVDTNQATFSGVSLGTKDGIAYYEVDFTAGNTDYRYAIDAMTGAVIESNSAASQTTGTNGTAAAGASNGTTAAAQTGAVDEARAKQIALDHAGVSESKAYDMDIELDDEDGTLVYEVEFKSGNMEYDYEIDAASGTILKHEAELDD